MNADRIKIRDSLRRTKTPAQNRFLDNVRVSSYGQTLDVLLDQFKAAGCARVYRKTATGAKAERRELQPMLNALAAGDVVTVTHGQRLIARRARRGGQGGAAFL